MSTEARNRRAFVKPLAVLALLAAVVAGLALGPSPAESAFPEANGKIAFVSTRDSNSEVYVMNADGSGQTNISNNAADDGHPDWQPQPAVGGIVEELVEGGNAPASTGAGSSSSSLLYAAIVGGTAVAAVALAAAGWYARRRWLR